MRRNQEPSKPSCTDFTPFVYAGCFEDPPSPAPHTLLYTSGLSTQNMTIETCVAFCKGNSYRYAGLEYYGECTCGASVLGGQIDEGQCSYPCRGNSTEVCGGFNAVSVYQDPTFQPVDKSTISDYMPLGCYSEGYNGRSLAWRQEQLSSADLTIEKCLGACKDGGFPIAGVEYAQECYCGVVLGNGTASIDSSTCNMPCTGNSAEICGGPSALNLFVAKDLESSQPCADVSSSSSSSTYPPTTSTTSTSSTSTSTSTTTTSSSSTSTTSSSSTSKPTTSTSTTKTTASLCTSTTTISPTPTCEYQCGSWCSNPLPNWSDKTSCMAAQSNCALQVTACFLNAGWPDSLKCFEFSSWCFSVQSYCNGYCPGGSCSKSGCKSKYPPNGPSQPSASVSTSVYTCPPGTSTAKPTSTQTPTSTSTVPVPTNTNICKQPNNPSKGYGSTSPVGDIPLPCLTCNNLYSDYYSGNPFKLYTSKQSSSCPSYGRNNPSQGCKDACDAQYSSCVNTYAQGCRTNPTPGGDSYSTASQKCTNQRTDCYTANSGVTVSSSRCNGWNQGWW
ncbi:WSC domain-containing protein [Tricladium varicosporioides]|nr:WSC domain-containing protein [Hymenoscyphus varicosporioides]